MTIVTVTSADLCHDRLGQSTSGGSPPVFLASSSHPIETIGMPALVAAEKFFSWPFLRGAGHRVIGAKLNARCKEQDCAVHQVPCMARRLYLKTNCVTPFLTLSHTSAPRLLARLFRQPPVFSALSSDLRGNVIDCDQDHRDCRGQDDDYRYGDYASHL